MQKKMLIAVLVIIVVAGGAYALFHKSTPSSSTATYGTTAKTQPAASGAVVQAKTASSVGSYLADSSGNALYTYGADTTGVSNCSGSCLYNWPAYAPGSTSTSLPTNVTIVTRSDNTKQYAYRGMPLYTFSGDSSGQVTGDGTANFHVAKP